MLAPLLSRGLFPMAPAAGLVLMDSGFDRVPRQSVATDAERAAALATPPQFILMSEEAVGVASSFWRDQILPEIQDQWHSTSAPAGTNLLEQYRKQAERLKLAPQDVAIVEDLWQKWKTEFGAEEEARAEQEKARRTAAACQPLRVEERGYRSMLPRGFATQLVAHFGIPPGQKAADIQRGLCAHIKDGHVSPTATAEELLAYVGTAGMDRLAKEGSVLSNR